MLQRVRSARKCAGQSDSRRAVGSEACSRSYTAQHRQLDVARHWTALLSDPLPVAGPRHVLSVHSLVHQSDLRPNRRRRLAHSNFVSICQFASPPPPQPSSSAAASATAASLSQRRQSRLWFTGVDQLDVTVCWRNAASGLPSRCARLHIRLDVRTRPCR